MREVCNSSHCPSPNAAAFPPVLYSGLPVRMAMSSQRTLYHAGAASAVVSLQKLGESLGQQCGLQGV